MERKKLKQTLNDLPEVGSCEKEDITCAMKDEAEFSSNWIHDSLLRRYIKKTDDIRLSADTRKLIKTKTTQENENKAVEVTEKTELEEEWENWKKNRYLIEEQETEAIADCFLAAKKLLDFPSTANFPQYGTSEYIRLDSQLMLEKTMYRKIL